MQVFPFHMFCQDITNFHVWLTVTSARFGKRDFRVFLQENS